MSYEEIESYFASIRERHASMEARFREGIEYVRRLQALNTAATLELSVLMAEIKRGEARMMKAIRDLRDMHRG